MVGVGEEVAGVATLTVVLGTAMATTAMGIMAMAMVITVMAIRMDMPADILPVHPIQADTQVGMAGQAEDLRVANLARMDKAAGILPGHPIQADTQVGMPGQVEDLRVVNLAEPDSPADTVGLWPQQDIRADQPPLGGVNLVPRR